MSTIDDGRVYILPDTAGEFGGVGPTPPRGRDKSRLYALAIASLGLFRAIGQQYPSG